MRDIFLILGIALAAVGLGAWILVYGPQQFQRITPTQQSVGLPITEPPPTSADNPQADKVTFKVLDHGIHATQVSERKNYAVYDATDLKKLWTMAHGSDASAPPAVDFTKYYVVAVFMGQQPTSGYDIKVSSVADTLATRTVFVSLSEPDKGCITSQLVTRPYQIVMVPLSDNALAHKDMTVTTPCATN